MDKTRIYLGEIQTQITFAKRAFEEYLLRYSLRSLQFTGRCGS